MYNQHQQSASANTLNRSYDLLSSMLISIVCLCNIFYYSYFISLALLCIYMPLPRLAIPRISYHNAQRIRIMLYLTIIRICEQIKRKTKLANCTQQHGLSRICTHISYHHLHHVFSALKDDDDLPEIKINFHFAIAISLYFIKTKPFTLRCYSVRHTKS